MNMLLFPIFALFTFAVNAQTPLPTESPAPTSPPIATPASAPTPSPTPIPTQAGVQPPSDSHKKSILSANVFAYYDWARSLSASGTISSGQNSDSFSANEDINAVPGIGISGEWLNQINDNFNAGVEFGFAYNLNRTITGVTDNVGQLSVHSDVNSNNTLGTSLIFFNGKFAYNAFYIFGGTNYPFLTLQGPGSVTPTVGYQFGAGVSIDDHWGVEAEYRVLNASGSASLTVSGREVTETVNLFSLSSLITSLRYSFR